MQNRFLGATNNKIIIKMSKEDTEYTVPASVQCSSRAASHKGRLRSVVKTSLEKACDGQGWHPRAGSDE